MAMARRWAIASLGAARCASFGVAVGDILEAKVERGRITLTPMSVVDRAVAEGLEDVRKGRVRGPFKRVDEMLNSLKGRKRRSVAKAS
jgi:hypothetical protein